MKTLSTHLFEPVAALVLILVAAALAILSPDSFAPLPITGLLLGALVRAMLPVNVGDMPAGPAGHWQSIKGVSLSPNATRAALGAVVGGLAVALLAKDPNFRLLGFWVASTAMSFRFATALPLWARR